MKFIVIVMIFNSQGTFMETFSMYSESVNECYNTVNKVLAKVGYLQQPIITCLLEDNE